MSKNKIDKNLLKELADLARIDLESGEEDMISDFKEIVGYFNELEKLDVEGIEPVSGGTDLINSFRKDDSQDKRLDPKSALKSLPDKKNGFLKVPSVFD